MGIILERGMDAFIEAEPNMSDTLVARLKSFLEYEAKSCSMDFGCVTPNARGTGQWHQLIKQL